MKTITLLLLLAGCSSDVSPVHDINIDPSPTCVLDTGKIYDAHEVRVTLHDGKCGPTSDELARAIGELSVRIRKAEEANGWLTRRVGDLEKPNPFGPKWVFDAGFLGLQVAPRHCFGDVHGKVEVNCP